MPVSALRKLLCHGRETIARVSQPLGISGTVRDHRAIGGSGPPIVVYRFEDSRAGECVAHHLEGYRGDLHVDGYTADFPLARREGADEGVRLAAC